MLTRSAAVMAAVIAASAGPGFGQESGMIGTGAPNDIFLEVTTGDKGQPILSEDEFELAWGGYYRFNLVCPEAVSDDTGFHFEAENLLANSHLRVISVGDIEVYMQGLGFP